MPTLSKNPVYLAMKAILDERGIPHKVEIGGKHPKCVFFVNGKKRSVPFTSTRTDYRAPYNQRRILLSVLDGRTGR